MSPLPIVSGRQMVLALERIGYQVVRQRGSHVRMRHASEPVRRPVTVPQHRELKPGTLRAILRDADLTVEALQELL